MQKFLGAAAFLGGLFLLYREHFIIGTLLVIAGSGIFKGADNDEFFSFDSSDSSDGGDGGGDGGGGD